MPTACEPCPGNKKAISKDEAEKILKDSQKQELDQYRKSSNTQKTETKKAEVKKSPIKKAKTKTTAKKTKNVLVSYAEVPDGFF